MTYRYRNDCHSTDPCSNPPPDCSAMFTANGQTGQQRFAPGSNITLEAQDKNAERYRWEIVVSPPESEAAYTHLAPHTILLMLPKPGAYVVELTASKGECRAQHRVIIWAVTPRLMYRIPASSEPLRFDGKPEWGGDVTQVILDVDRNLPTDDEKTALRGFNEHHPPSGQNPYATREDLLDRPGPSGRQLTDDEVDAIKAAENPDKCNPFITQSALPPAELTQDQKEAIAAADNPNRCNPFITQSALPSLGLSDNQKAALRERPEHLPTLENYFITREELPGPELTDNQRAALQERPEYPPNSANYFVTLAELPGPELTADQQAALDAAEKPGAANPFITQSALPDPELSDNQKAALREERDYPPTSDNLFITRQELPKPELTANQLAALRERPEHPPSENNYFVTREELPQPELTPEQEAALDAAKNPNQNNPFVTLNDLTEKFPLSGDEIAAIKQAGDPVAAHQPSGENPFVTRGELPGSELTLAQKAALDAAKEPGGDNPFITRSALPDDPKLTPEQKAALDAAKSPSASNAFITESALPPPELTDNQKAAINAANNPSAINPFITLENLPTSDFTSDQKAAIYAAKSPSANNAFITQNALPEPELTSDQQAALKAANSPKATNPLATLADLNQLKPGVRIVAAGQIDLKQEAPAGANVWGGLRVVNNRLVKKGMALLSFNGYQSAQQSRYIVKALPIIDKAGNQASNKITLVQFVEFRDDGFVLQMAQRLKDDDNDNDDNDNEGQATLGSCMIEVSEIVGNS